MSSVENTIERLRQSVERYASTGQVKPVEEDPALISSLFPAPGSKSTDRCTQPSSRENLYRRLHTYKVGTWFCKPEVTGPLACALHGWINTKVDLISCEICKAKLSLPIPALLPHDQVQELAEAFAAKLASGHADTCLWRNSEFRPELATFPPITSEAALEGFTRRISRIAKLGPLPCVELQPGVLPPCIWSRCRRQLELLMTPGFQPGPQVPALRSLPSIDDSPSKSTSAALSAMPLPEPATDEGVMDLSREQKQQLLALFGWNLRTPDPGSLSQPLLFCTMCGVKCGLWNFKPDETDPVAGWRPGTSLAGRGKQSGGGSGFGMFTIAGGNFQAKARLSGLKRPFGSGSMAAFGSSAAMNGAGSASPATPAPVFGNQETIAGGTLTPNSEPRPSREGPAEALPESIANGVSSSSANGMHTGVPATKPSTPAAASGAASPVPAVHPFGISPTSSAVPAFGLEVLRSASQAASQAAEAAAVEEICKEGAPNDGLEPTANGPGPHREEGDGRAAKRQRIIASEANGPGDGPVSTARSGVEPVQPPPEAVASWLTGQEPLDPLKLHRPFCPWANGSMRGKEGDRCGWQYCLSLLVPMPAGQDEDGQPQPHREEGGWQSQAQQRLDAAIRKIRAAS